MKTITKDRDYYLYADFEDFPDITEEVKQKNLSRTFTGSVRLGKGMYRTTAETNAYIL